MAKYRYGCHILDVGVYLMQEMCNWVFCSLLRRGIQFLNNPILLCWIVSLCIADAPDQEFLTCTQDSSIAHSITWPATNQCTISTPPCLNSRREFQERCCSHGIWDPEPHCSYIQSPIPNCPENFKFDSLNQLCYAYTGEKSEFPPRCPFEDVVPFQSYRDLVDSKQFGPVWMPVRRDLTNGLGFLDWIEPSRFYRTNFEENYYAPGSILGKNCLIFYNSSYIEAVSCHENHYGFCAYDQLNTLRNNLCQFEEDLCRQSDFSSTSKCFCVGGVQAITQHSPDFQKVEFLKPYQNRVYDSLTSDECLIGLEKSPSDLLYVWSSDQSPVNYTNWSSDVMFSPSHIYGAIRGSGWTLLTTDDLPCVLYERPIKNPEPSSLVLVWNGTSDLFTIRVVNPLGLKWLRVDEELLLYCFTEATPYNLLYRYPQLIEVQPKSRDVSIFQFRPSNHGPGHYWCESFKYPDLKPIKSNTIFLAQLDKFDAEYVAILKVSYIRGSNPLSKQIIEFLERILFLTLGQVHHLKDFYLARVTQILEIDEISNEIFVNVHFTSRGQNPRPNLETEYHKVQAIISKALEFIQYIKIDLVDFRSPEFCMQQQTNISGTVLNWPTTPVRTRVRSREFCFRSDTTRMTRQCLGNFTTGGFWSRIGPSCEIMEKSEYSGDLEDILENDDDVVFIVDRVLNISSNFDHFRPLDVYLIGQIFKKLANSLSLDSRSIDLDSLVKIVGNLHRIPYEILWQSQTMMNATDEILHYLDRILLNQAPKFDHLEATSSHFFIVISNLSVSNMTGLVLEHQQGPEDGFATTILRGPVDLDELQNNFQNLESAVLLSPQLRNDIITNNSQIIVTLFFTDALFKERNLNKRQFVTKVFGVLLPDLTNPLPNPVSIVHKTSLNNMKENCAFWNFSSQNQGFWNKDNMGQNFPQPSLTLCEFWHVTHFALLLMSDLANLNQIDDSVLDWITMVNCSLSLVGLVGILMTGILFKRWRSNTGNQILINFVLAISLQIATFYISNTVFKDLDNPLVCTITGVILHYSIVSQFCWMFIIAVLQFKRFVEVLGGPPKYVLLKACFCGWILPLLPVLCVILLDNQNYVSGHVNLCYPSGLGLYLGVWLPIAIVVLVNFVIFVYIIYNVVHRKTECVDAINDETMFQWRLAILLFFMLGLTWGFGFLCEWNFGIVFVYLFTATATLQGFVMFLFFIVFNTNTRFLYCRSLRACCYRNKYY